MMKIKEFAEVVCECSPIKKVLSYLVAAVHLDLAV
jgi:hypothetical protein